MPASRASLSPKEGRELEVRRRRRRPAQGGVIRLKERLELSDEKIDDPRPRSVTRTSKAQVL
jgi:hypothetical protein